MFRTEEEVLFGFEVNRNEDKDNVISIGANSLYVNAYGSYNTAIGYNTNTLLGYPAGYTV